VVLEGGSTLLWLLVGVVGTMLWLISGWEGTHTGTHEHKHMHAYI
jgi:hypothetical protein